MYLRNYTSERLCASAHRLYSAYHFIFNRTPLRRTRRANAATVYGTDSSNIENASFRENKKITKKQCTRRVWVCSHGTPHGSPPWPLHDQDARTPRSTIMFMIHVAQIPPATFKLHVSNFSMMWYAGHAAVHVSTRIPPPSVTLRRGSGRQFARVKARASLQPLRIRAAAVCPFERDRPMELGDCG